MDPIDTKTLSPKELGQVVGVSESSIKRWGDEGRIQVTRTAGGHRRILLRDALRFIRGQEMPVLRPDLLGLPEMGELPADVRSGELSGNLLLHLLKNGEAEKVRSVILGEYLEGTRLAEIIDGPLAQALAELGVLWRRSDDGIYVEHMATNICIEALNQIRMLMPPAVPDSPLAIGGAPKGDPYILPSLMAATVLLDAGFTEINLGAHTPSSALLHAVEEHQPDLVWLAMTSNLSKAQLVQLNETLFQPLIERQIQIVAGGQQAVHARGLLPEPVVVLESMGELADHAEAALGS